MINAAFGRDFTARHIEIKFVEIDDCDICEIDINAGLTPLFMEVVNKNGQKLKKFYVSSGNTSQDLAIDETAAYVEERFGD